MSLLAESVARDARYAGLSDVLLETPLVVGVSGGADSLALLSVLRELRGTHAASTLHVAHLDHGFRGDESAADARFVEELAREWELACTVAYFDVPAYAASRKLSAEDAARRVRYAFLAGVAQKHGSLVAVAHNADDQAETVLMHLLRGSGVTGLAGMRMLSDIPVDTSDPALRLVVREGAPSMVQVFRPLLGIWRADIEAYCRELGLVPRLDASNLDPAYRRNFIRHEVLPGLEAASPQVKRHLARLADIAAAEDDVLQQVTDQEWDRLGVEVKDGQSISVSVEAIAALPLGIARRVVRRMLQTVTDRTDGTDFQQIDTTLQVLCGAPDTPKTVDLAGGLRIRRRGAVGVIEQQAGEGRPDAVSGIHDRPVMYAETAMRLDRNATVTLANGWRV
ncbi:MAG TPA: tRNA lysidine(34) synthetase TilS, partial [Chloroflexia bacterium]